MLSLVVLLSRNTLITIRVFIHSISHTWRAAGIVTYKKWKKSFMMILVLYLLLLTTSVDILTSRLPVPLLHFK